MWIDLLITAPVTLFLLWLFWYSSPDRRTVAGRWLDRVLLLAAPVSAITIIVLCHQWMDVAGAGLNVIAVASAYLTVVAILSVGWWSRWRSGQRPRVN